jgi:transcriptional regulator with XRE-family HTH domain
VIPGARIAREALDLTQQEVADAIGVHRQQYQRYESGRTVPSLTKAAEIAKALNCTIEFLVAPTAERSAPPASPPTAPLRPNPDAMVEGSEVGERRREDRRRPRSRDGEAGG